MLGRLGTCQTPAQAPAEMVIPLLSLFHLFGSPQIGITFFKVMNFYYNCPLQFRFHLWIIPWYFAPQTKGVSWKIS